MQKLDETFERFLDALLEQKGNFGQIDDTEAEPVALLDFALSPEQRLYSRFKAEDDRIYYYEPIFLNGSCIECHDTNVNSMVPEIYRGIDRSQASEPMLSNTPGDPSNDAVPLEERPENEEQSRLTQLDNEINLRAIQAMRSRGLPNFYSKIAIDYTEVEQSIAWTRAILLAMAIATALFSIFVLYWIVRYVIVKPLNHLREVTDEVSHGRLDVRAELRTGDEFEELSTSFNKMLRNLTDSQRALEEVNADLDRKVDEQAQLTLSLYELNRVKSEFLATMSHELRTPLNSILGFSEVLETAPDLDGRQLRFVGNIKKSGRLLLELINDILDLAKLESGAAVARIVQFQVRPVLDELIEMVRSLAEEKKIQLQFDCPPGLPDMQQDQLKLRQIGLNLLSNAIKFTPEGGRIKLSVVRRAPRTPSPDDADETCPELEMTVSDSGIGISHDEQETIFEKFRQGKSAIGNDSLTREHSGTGLGLSIVRELCRLLGGSITVQSELGKGSQFTVRLPWVLSRHEIGRSELAGRIEELTKVNRINFSKVDESPEPPANSDENVNQQNGSQEHGSQEHGSQEHAAGDPGEPADSTDENHAAR